MSNDNSPVARDNPSSSTTCISVVLDDEAISFMPFDLLDDEFRRSIAEHTAGAAHVMFPAWERIARLADGPRDLLLELATRPTNSSRDFLITDRDQPLSDAFTATLAIPLDRENLSDCGRLVELAVAAAGRCHPQMSRAAAQQIRDWQIAHGMAAETVTAIARQISGNRAILGSDDISTPQGAANVVLAQLQAERDRNGEDTSTTPPLRYFNGDFYRWTGNVWQRVDRFDLFATRILQQIPAVGKLTTTFISGVVKNIEAMTLLDVGNIRLPVYIGQSAGEVSSVQTLTMSNGMLNLQCLSDLGNSLTLQPFDARVFGSPVLPVAFDPAAGCSLWEQTLLELLPPSMEEDLRVQVLQEFFGYCILNWNHSLETFVILIGDGANGKSVVLSVLREMLGQVNVSGVPLDALASEFRPGEMIGKLANIATDMQRMPRVQEGLLKQLISGEPTQMNSKYKSPVTVYPTAKLVFATNWLPPFSDTSEGIWRRMLVIPFLEQFGEDRRDLHRAERLRRELSGIFNWALAGAARLIHQGAFTACQVCNQAKGEHRHDSDPFRQFIDECCDMSQGAVVPVDEMYLAYREFCDHAGKGAKAKPEFGKQIRTLGIERSRSTTERRHYEYLGIALRPGVLSRNPPRYCVPRARPRIGGEPS